jgi:hypothetical protein
MHSIKNISERSKIDTQSRADAYIRRKRLISKSVWMHLKVFLKLKKTLKTLSSGQIYLKKKTKNPKKPKKNQKTQKTHWAGFFNKKNGFFSNPASNSWLSCSGQEDSTRPWLNS